LVFWFSGFSDRGRWRSLQRNDEIPSREHHHLALVDNGSVDKDIFGERESGFSPP
jgi:hypothetical protein